MRDSFIAVDFDECNLVTTVRADNQIGGGGVYVNTEALRHVCKTKAAKRSGRQEIPSAF